MAYNYDALYRDTPDALGAPTQAFVNFFETYPKGGAKVLDIGCGQGRDALFIARLGHHVTGVDLSPAGIRDLENAATVEALPITGVVADIVTYQPTGLFDIVVIDRTLHMLPAEDRITVLRRLMAHVAGNGSLLIADERANLPAFRDEISSDDADWQEIRFEKGFLFVQRAG